MDEDDCGPRTEVAWWQRRATRLNSVADDLTDPKQECHYVLAVLMVCKSRKMKTWKQSNNAITDA